MRGRGVRSDGKGSRVKGAVCSGCGSSDDGLACMNSLERVWRLVAGLDQSVSVGDLWRLQVVGIEFLRGAFNEPLLCLRNRQWFGVSKFAALHGGAIRGRSGHVGVMFPQRLNLVERDGSGDGLAAWMRCADDLAAVD